MVRKVCWALALTALLAASPLAKAAEAPARADEPPTRAGPAPLSGVDLDRLLAPLLADGAGPRATAATAVTTLGPEAVDAIAARLGELRRAPTAPLSAAVKLARAPAGKDGDLLEALLALKTERDGGKADPAGARAAIATVALVRALAHAGTAPAVRALVRVAGDHGGALRPELGRLVRGLGDRSLAALVETRKDAPADVRAWAYTQLEGMGKRIPGDAVQTRDAEVLADVLRAYARIGDLDALPVLLSFVNADRVQVRAAAREATVSFGPEAIWKLREAYGNVAGRPALEGWSTTEVARELFATYDRLRLQEVYGLLDAGLRAQHEGRLDDALAAFDKVLARQPMLDRRAETVPAYVAHGQRLADQDPAAARAALEKARRLAPDGPRVAQIEAGLAYLDGKELLARGIVDEEPFRRALARDPGHAGARLELDRIEERTLERAGTLRAFAGAGAVLLVGVVAAILFGGFRRRSSPRARG